MPVIFKECFPWLIPVYCSSLFYHFKDFYEACCAKDLSHGTAEYYTLLKMDSAPSKFPKKVPVIKSVKWAQKNFWVKEVVLKIDMWWLAVIVKLMLINKYSSEHLFIAKSIVTPLRKRSPVYLDILNGGYQWLLMFFREIVILRFSP